MSPKFIEILSQHSSPWWAGSYHLSEKKPLDLSFNTNFSQYMSTMYIRTTSLFHSFLIWKNSEQMCTNCTLLFRYQPQMLDMLWWCLRQPQRESRWGNCMCANELEENYRNWQLEVGEPYSRTLTLSHAKLQCIKQQTTLSWERQEGYRLLHCPSNSAGKRC